MNKLTITAGIEQDRDGNTISDADKAHALDLIRNYLALKFGGYTEIDTAGGYTMRSTGALVTEQGKRWEVASAAVSYEGAGYLNVLDTARMIRDTLAQESVMVEVSAPNIEFV